MEVFYDDPRVTKVFIVYIGIYQALMILTEITKNIDCSPMLCDELK